MEFFTFPNFDIYYTEPEDSELHTIEVEGRKILNQFLRRPAYRQLVHKNSFRLINEKFVLLRAHGKILNGEYIFHDGNRVRWVQDWINEHDGKANTLVVMACSHPLVSITSRRSLVMHPFGTISSLKLSQRERVRMFVPGIGYVEDNRSLLRKALREFN